MASVSHFLLPETPGTCFCRATVLIFQPFGERRSAMTNNLLQRAKGIFFGPGPRKNTPEETRSPFFSPSEIASLKRQAKDAKEEALAEQDKRAHKANPRILAARKA